MSIDRRTLLKGGLGSGALVAVGASPAVADQLPTTGLGRGTDRRSSLFPGRRLVHADLHNHSHLSDGAGDPALLHDKLRAAGIDVGALTDHSVAAFAFDRVVCTGVRRALLDHRVFATREAGLRLAATADGKPMSETIRRKGRDTVRFALDLDLGPERSDVPVEIQVLRPGMEVPEVADVIEARPSPLIRFSVPLDRDDGDWIVLRIAAPARPNDAPAPFDHACNNFALAYSSPWRLDGSPRGGLRSAYDVGTPWTVDDAHWLSHHQH